MVTLKLTDVEASELASLVLYELREAERYYISNVTLRMVDQQLRDQGGEHHATAGG